MLPQYNTIGKNLYLHGKKTNVFLKGEKNESANTYIYAVSLDLQRDIFAQAYLFTSFFMYDFE